METKTLLHRILYNCAPGKFGKCFGIWVNEICKHNDLIWQNVVEYVICWSLCD